MKMKFSYQNIDMTRYRNAARAERATSKPFFFLNFFSQRKMFYSIQYTDLFPMFTQLGDSSNRQIMNGCSCQHFQRQNFSWFLS